MFKNKNIKYLIIILIFGASISLFLFLYRDTFSADSDQEEISYILIDIIQAKESYDEGTHLFIDARDELLYSFGYIPGAVNLSLEKIDQLKIAFENKYSKNTKIIVYCSGPQCSSTSFSLAKKLIEMGYENVMIFYGGWKDWVESSYPVEKFVRD